MQTLHFKKFNPSLSLPTDRCCSRYTPTVSIRPSHDGREKFTKFLLRVPSLPHSKTTKKEEEEETRKKERKKKSKKKDKEAVDLISRVQGILCWFQLNLRTHTPREKRGNIYIYIKRERGKGKRNKRFSIARTNHTSCSHGAT